VNGAGFNTLGWIKNEIHTLSVCCHLGPNEGIYKYNPNPKRVVFIHSCNLGDLSMLEYLLSIVKPLDCEVHVINIGEPITKDYNVILTNYSQDILLYEIPTINAIRNYCLENHGCYILYLHTKGVSYQFMNTNVNDWINMMLHFLMKKNTSNLLHQYDTIGCNYLQKEGVPPHWSGNFWWARSDYIRTLPLLETDNKYSAEMWLFTNQPSFHELHNSRVDHYLEGYPKKYYN
jgi:hypothetical protein